MQIPSPLAFKGLLASWTDLVSALDVHNSLVIQNNLSLLQ